MRPMRFKYLHTPGLFVFICAVIVMLCCGGCAADIHFENAEIDEDEEIAEAYSVLTEIGDGADAIEKDYLNDDGFVGLEQMDGLLEEINEYAASLYEEGVISDYRYQSGDTCVYMQIDGWLGCLYDPPLDNVLSGGSEKPQIITLESVHAPLMFALAGFRGPDDTARMIEENDPSFTFSGNYDKDDVTIETIRELPQNSIIIWSGHGAYNSEVGSALCLGGMANSSLKRPSANYQSMMLLYREELQDKAILSTTSGGFCVTSKFFEKYMPENALYDDVVYLGSCYSYYLATYDGYEDSRLVDSILGLGASVVLGNTYAVSPIYSYKMIDSFFEGLAEPTDNEAFRTVEEALAYAKEKNGKEDVINKSEVFAKLAEGMENFRLSDMLQNAQVESTNQTYSECMVQGCYPGGWDCSITFSEAMIEERIVMVREYGSGTGSNGEPLAGYEESSVTFISLAPGSRVTVPPNTHDTPFYGEDEYYDPDDPYYSQAVCEGTGVIVDNDHYELEWSGSVDGFYSGTAEEIIRWDDRFLMLDTDQFDTDYCFIVLGADSSNIFYLLLPENEKVQAICAADSYTLAVTSDGSLWTWGKNFYGQLGDGTTTNRYSPAKIMDNVVAISADADVSFAIKDDGSLWAWGYNFAGRLGDGTTTDHHSPVKVMDNVAAISAGSAPLAIKTDGSLWAWGSNYYGNCGNGSTTDCYLPIKIMDNVRAIAAGNHSLAIQTDGSLWTWGNNSYGQLGDGTTTDSHIPIKVLDGVVAASVGATHSFAIKTDGSLWAWGNNDDGQLGDGTITDHRLPMKFMDNVIKISAGPNHALAIQVDGSLWGWGNNDIAQLGDVSSIDSRSPIKIMDDIVEASGGERYSMAVKSDGSLWAWGANQYGQLGNGTTVNQDSPTKILIKGITN